LAQIIPTLQSTKSKTLENLAQQLPTSLREDEVISDVIKNAVYGQRRTFNKSFSKGKK